MKLSLFLSLLPSVLAQYGNSGSSSSASSSAASTTKSSSSSSVQTITVGNSGFRFSPDSVTVAPGNSVVFQFYPGDHSVVQSSFDAPCAPVNSSALNSGFIDSSSGPAANVFTVPITSTDPIWIYCAQIGHCQGGMVAVINPPSSGQTLDQYRSAAAKASKSSSPSKVQGGTVGPASSASPSSSGTSSTAASATSKSDGYHGKEMGFGILVAVAGGIVANLLV